MAEKTSDSPQSAEVQEVPQTHAPPTSGAPRTFGPKLFGTATYIRQSGAGEKEGGDGGVALALFPTPVNEYLDPLNYPTLQKYTCLTIVCVMYFLFTYLTTTTVATLPDLQDRWGLSLDQANWTLALPALGLAVGPLFWSPVAETFGRRITFIIGTIIALAATIGAGGATNFAGYMAARFFQGWGVSPATNVGLAIINDLFFEHERGRVLGLWVLAIDTGLLIGPLFGSLIALVSVDWVQWLLAILFGSVLVAEFFFLPETLYPRQYMLHGDGVAGEKGGEPAVNLPQRTKNLPFLNFRPVPAIAHPKPWDAVVRFGKTFAQAPNCAIPVFFYCFGWYWWILCVITEWPVAYEQYSAQIQGVLFLGMILGTVLAEVFVSGTLSDWIVVRLALRNGGKRTPSMRLWLIYPAVTVSAVGIIVWGIAIDKGYHWAVSCVCSGLFAGGLQVGNTVVSSYIVDCYPANAMTVVVFYAVCLNLSAFLSPFFIATWEAASGFTWCFAAQGIISFCVIVFAFVPLQIWGDKMLERNGSFTWTDGGFESQPF